MQHPTPTAAACTFSAAAAPAWRQGPFRRPAAFCATSPPPVQVHAEREREGEGEMGGEKWREGGGERGRQTDRHWHLNACVEREGGRDARTERERDRERRGGGCCR